MANSANTDLIFDAALLAERDYWIERLGGKLDRSGLPTDRPKSAETRGASSSVPLRFAPRHVEKLLTLTKGSSFLFYTALMAALKVCLYRYTRNRCVIVGSPAFFDGGVDTNPNALVIVDQLDDALSFRQFLVNVRETLLDAYARQTYPIDRLIKDLDPDAGPNQSPLFDIALVMEGIHTDLPALEHDVTIRFRLSGDNCHGTIDYNPAIFDVVTVRRFAEHLLNILDAGLSDHNQSISELEILSAHERQQILTAWNNTKRPYSVEVCIHEVIERQVERTPDALALVFDDQQLTYQGLNERANRLAHHLRSLGVKPDLPIGIFMERSTEMIVGLLGVLKAGAAYVPLDPAYPAPRLAFMIEDSGITLLLTRAALKPALPSHNTATHAARSGVGSSATHPCEQTPIVVVLDEDWPLIARESKDNPSSIGSSDNLAYVLYTSGSSGQPKAVMVEHKQVLNYVQGIQDRLGENPGASYAMVQPLTVDSCVTVIFPALSSGGCLHLLTRECSLDPCQLAEYFNRHTIDCLKIAPSHLRALQAGRDPTSLLPEKWLVIGGEASFQDWMWKLQAAAPDLKVFNHYGPTEATVGTLMQPVNDDGDTTAVTPLGYPLPNTTRYILDRHLEPTGVGIPGQLYLGGQCLSRGYLRRPDLTAASFLPHPFTTESGHRLYQTGDMTRVLEHGSVAFMGRTDQQVKIRGFRIELGEIQAALATHSEVRECIVTAVAKGPDSDKRLVAYVVTVAPVSLESLRQHLTKQVPRHMIPSAWVFLEYLPRTPHGKLDPTALPDPDQDSYDRGSAFLPPRNPTEERLTEIWQEILRADRVGVYDNFFELGGHSLLATQAVSRMRDSFEVELPLRELFESPTIAAIAERIDTSQRGLDAPPLVPISRQGDLPLSFAQQRLWFLDQFAPGEVFYNIPAAVRARGPFEREALRGALEALVQRHEVLRTTFESVEGKPVQIIDPTSTVRLPVVDLRDITDNLRETEAKRVGVAEANEPFDLTRGPLLRVKLLHLAENDHVVLLTMHHIASDGWSVQILVHEISSLYESVSQGTPSALPALPLQYADFAVWQRQWLQGDVLEAQLGYWREQLAGSPPVLRWPTRERPPDKATSLGAQESIHVSAPTYRTIKALANETGTTPYTVLLAAFKVLIHRVTGEDDLWVGTPIANRNRSEIENLIGFFVNTLILRTDLSHNPSFQEVLRRVQKTVLEAYTHQDLPYEELVAKLAPVRRDHPGGLAQIYFAFQQTSIGSTEVFHGLRLSPFDTNTEKPRGGLTLFVTEGMEEFVASFSYSSTLFDSKTIVAMAQQFRTILETVAADGEQRIATLPPFPKDAATRRRDLEEIYEHSNLTMNQLSIWLEQKAQPAVPCHDMAATFTLHTAIDPEHFRQAFTTLVNSSDALRSVIEEQHGTPLRRVKEPGDQPMEFLDVSYLENPHGKTAEWVLRLSENGMDLIARPFHCALIKVSETEYVWYLNLHPILFDVTSRTLMIRYMTDLHEQARTSQIPEVIDIPPFENYVTYEREYRLSPRCQESQTYWNAKLSRDVEAMTYYGKPALKTSTHTQTFSFDLDPECTQKLQSAIKRPDIFTKTANVTLFNVFASLVYAYLHHVSGNLELSLATSFHNRRSPTLARTLGLFTTVQPLRVAVTDHDTLVSLTRKVTLEAAETLRHSDFSTASAVPEKTDILINLAGSNHSFGGKPADLKPLRNPANYALQITLQIHQPPSFQLHFSFHGDVFDAATCAQAIGHFRRILTAMLDNPTQRINDIPLLSEAERMRILDEFNRTKVPFPTDETLPARFEAQAATTPNSIALVAADESLTYGDLNARANQWAHHLRTLGITLESRVGICMARSVELLVGILGILKAGAAYVPLDPSYPEDRLAFMIADAGLAVLLTQQTLRQRFTGLLIDAELTPHDRTPAVICMDEAWHEISQERNDNFACGLTPDNAAYLIYTSGSTGKPKGVLTTHRGVINHNFAASEAYNLQPDDRVLQFHSIAFDAAVEEILPIWFSGGTLVLRGEELPSVQALMEVAVEQQLTAMILPTAYWHTWAHEITDPSAGPPPNLRLVSVGGERAGTEQFEAWRRRDNGVRWLNSYGPTEATIIVTTFAPLPGFTTDNGIPIGRPIANTKVYLLNGAMNPVPMAMPGDLYIGGPGVARGYLNQPAPTAEKFLADPFASGARLYKTGDIGRYRQNGNIDFVGRRDHQVKIRGFRVELGEIEAVLSGHPAVREAVVLAKNIQSGSQPSVDTELVGYVSCDTAQAPNTSELRGFLQEKLPEYMVPQFFVTLDSFPLSPTGKVDRKALKSPERTTLEPEKTFVAPRTALEERVAGIWKEVMHVDQVGVYDNFFELGGHSLLATQVVARIHKQFAVVVPLRDLFESPTVARLAELIEQQPTADFSSLVIIQARGSRPPFFCVHPVQGTVLSYYNLARHMGSNQPFYGLQAEGLQETPPEYRSIETMAAHYIDRIRETRPEGPYSLGGWSVGGVIAFEMAQQLTRRGERVASLALIDSYVPKYSGEVEPLLEIDAAVAFLRRLGLDEERVEHFRHLAFDAQVAFMLEQAQKAAVVPDEITVNHALLARHIGNAMAQYRPMPYQGHTLLLKASESPHTQEPTNGWAPYVGSQLEARMVPGTHFTMVEEPNVKVLATELAKFLDSL